MSIFRRKKKARNEAHIRNLVMMAKADNFIDSTEVEIIIDIGVARGMEEKKIRALLKDKTPQEIITPDNDRAKFEQVYDLILVMVADGIIKDDEMEFIAGFGQKLGWSRQSSEVVVTKIIEGMQGALSKEEVFSSILEF